MSTFKRTDWQKTVWDDTHRFKVINCGRRAGKSTLAAYRMAKFASDKAKRIVWYIAPTYKQAKQIMFQMLHEIIPQAAIKKTNETELKFELINDSRIELKGADTPDSLRGVRIDLAIFDEVAFFDKWEESWKVIRPTLMDSKAEVLFISTPNGFNHFKTLTERTDPDWQYFHFTTFDNPFIDLKEIEQSKIEMGEDGFAQEVMGEFRKMSGLIYKEFSRDTHMIETPDITGWTRGRAIDFGYGHKTAVGWFAVNSDGSHIHVYDGIYQSQLTLDQIADAVKIKDGQQMITTAVGDSAQPMYLAELDHRSVHFDPIEKGPDSVRMGIQKVATMLKPRGDTGKPTLTFAKHLDWIASEFERYRWMENKVQGIIKEAPLKNEDDAMDMIRYFIMHFNKPISEMQVRSLPQFQPEIDIDLGL